MLREEKAEREASLSDQSVEVNSHQRSKGAVIVVHGSNLDPPFDQSIAATYKIQRLLWYIKKGLRQERSQDLTSKVAAWTTIARDATLPLPFSAASTMTMSLTPDV